MSVEASRSHDASDLNPSLFNTQRWIRTLPVLIVGVVALVAIGSVFDALFDRTLAVRQARYQSHITQVRHVDTALLETENALQGFAISGRVVDLARFVSRLERLESEMPPILPLLDGFADGAPDTDVGLTPPSRDFAELRTSWDGVGSRDGDSQSVQAEVTETTLATSALVDRLRNSIADYLAQLATQAAVNDNLSQTEQRWLDIFDVACATLATIAMLYAFRRIIRALDSGFAARHQVEQLFFMADMLQSAGGQEDTNEVLRATSTNLLPGFSGALYVFNNSRDRLDLSTSWGPLAEENPDHITPDSCWALKRGKPHLNQAKEGALRCSHAKPEQAILEIPMVARGQLHGLLKILGGGPNAEARLEDARPVATAMGDAISLALSSVDLRERLKNLALRDALTGLYNRRFLEEMQQRLGSEAERQKTSVSAIMIDLDHFKKINDQHGHAAGDNILREVSASILSCLRAVDVACRYGGEEFAVLLPGCSLRAATTRAEEIRSRISERTAPGPAPVTVSLGVASIPETCVGISELLPTADAALYMAKHQGRNCVVAAAIRSSAQKLSLIETDPSARPTAQPSDEPTPPRSRGI
jgi:diguanylate cyclase (GGDEF)-like protein